MSGSLNRVMLIGNVGKDPEIKTLSNGAKVVNFSVATSDNWKDKTSGERKERTEWHNVVIFNENLIKIVEAYVHKGSKLYVEGSLQTRKWTDKSGSDRYTTEIVLSTFNGTITLLDAKPANGSGEQIARGNAYLTPSSKSAEDPFANL